jgi:tRNA pseudouridine38-40 synthase
MASASRELDTSVRKITSLTVCKRGSEIMFRVRGNGFLYKQVRSMVGFLIRVGLGAEKPEAVKELLDEHPVRTARVPSAPARGLFLWQVWYGK